jgi:predicted DNA-binding protein (MmcQ/YjbR family)
MKPADMHEYCRSLPGATEDIKWGKDLIFSVGGKMFAGFDADGGQGMGFKCSVDDFDVLTKRPGIIPAPYAARFGWVSLTSNTALDPAEAKKYVLASYTMVREALPKRVRESSGGEQAAQSAPAKGKKPAKKAGKKARTRIPK